MRKVLLFAAVAFVAAAFCGCASVTKVDAKDLNGQDISYSGKPVAHVVADNWGLYVFSIPLITGDTANPGKTVFLQDTVTVAKVTNMMTAESKKMGASKVYNIVSSTATNPFFFGFKEVQISANLVK